MSDMFPKFRAWIYEEGKYIYQDDNTASCMEGLEYFTQLVGAAKSTPTIEQFIGMQDKNKQDVYVGDIIKMKEGGEFEIYYSLTRVAYRGYKVVDGNRLGESIDLFLPEIKQSAIVGNKNYKVISVK